MRWFLPAKPKYSDGPRIAANTTSPTTVPMATFAGVPSPPAVVLEDLKVE